MIKFPTWVETPRRQPKQQLAAKRLRYLVVRASIQRTFGGHIASFATAIGMDKSTIHLYIKLGKFSKPSAEMAENIFGSDVIQADWLTSPLTIEVD